jgi:hypothetical protein
MPKKHRFPRAYFTGTWTARAHAPLVDALGTFAAGWLTSGRRSAYLGHKPLKLAFDLITAASLVENLGDNPPTRLIHKVLATTPDRGGPIHRPDMSLLKAILTHPQQEQIGALLAAMRKLLRDPNHPLSRYYQSYRKTGGLMIDSKEIPLPTQQ